MYPLALEPPLLILPPIRFQQVEMVATDRSLQSTLAPSSQTSVLGLPEMLLDQPAKIIMTDMHQGQVATNNTLVGRYSL